MGACPSCRAEVVGRRCPACGAALRAGRFSVERVLHEGPAGRVYVAVDEGGRRVALKELVFHLVPGAAELEAFERETALLRQVNHPRVPRLLDTFADGEGAALRLYMATTLVDGETLEAVVARGPLRDAELVDTAGQLLRILRDLHALRPRILHRDIKPQNLLRDARDGALWLVDFGAARDLRQAVTLGTTLVGTWGYMPPEQLAGVVSEQSDLYAVGATLLHLATGTHPLQLPSSGRVPDLRRVTLPRRMRPLLEALLQEDPARRPRSAEEALALLEKGAPRRWKTVVATGAWAAGLVAAVGWYAQDIGVPEVVVVSPPPVTPPREEPRVLVDVEGDFRIPLVHGRYTEEGPNGRKDVRCDSPRTAFVLRRVQITAPPTGDTRELALTWAFINGADRACFPPGLSAVPEGGAYTHPRTGGSLRAAQPHATIGHLWSWVVPASSPTVDITLQAWGERPMPVFRVNMEDGSVTRVNVARAVGAP